MENFFISEYIYGLTIMAIVWLVSTRMGASLDKLEVNERIIRIEVETGVYEPRSDIRGELVNNILLVGVGMILVAGLLRFDRFTAWVKLPSVRASVYNILAYFLLGLVLLSLTQYNRLRARWLRDGAPIQAGIGRRWVIYSLVFILAASLVAAILPTGYTVGILALLNTLLFGLFAILNFIISLIMVPFILLLGLVNRFLGDKGDVQPAPEMQVIPFYEPTVQSQPVLWWEVIKSGIFWLVLIGAIVFSITYYFKENQYILERMRRLPVLSYLANFWEWVKAWTRAVNHRLSAAVAAGRERLSALRRSNGTGSPRRYINLRRLSPREKVLFYFSALVRRGQERGVKRGPAQTPYEYSEDLSNAIKAAGQNGDPTPDITDRGSSRSYDVEDQPLKVGISEMTKKFVEARYSRHEVTAQDAGIVQRYWGRIRRALRGPLWKEDDHNE